ncbi:PREDICTED: pheromone-binding protein Gp-9-like [Dinoponera quadriceps]|uniref:Pheromone-binding protein Gp-9 n=1 Tax=Dinoponera quadriceps TaxID=609295 RepID=A0A6P3WMI1_DINQU|nr:PREDICTED: pheromone-binding protein Gp-9-like [Dinoponera quadriceps]
MKLLVLSVCLLATVMITSANTVANLALHGSKLSPEEVQQCYESTNLKEDELITYDEIKNGTYVQNPERATKNGCFSACILEKRELIVNGEIQKDKLYAKEAHANLNHDVRGAIHAAVNRCVEEVKTNPDLCDKSLSLLVCLSKKFI